MSFLPFWAANMLHVRGAGLDWIGFRYTEAEWRRMEALGGGVSEGGYRAFLVLNAVLFIALAGALIGLILVPVLGRLYPDPSQLSAIVFFGLLGAIALFAIAIGLPLTMSVTARLLARWVGTAAPATGDDALAAKVRGQIARMTLFVTALALTLIGLSIGFGIDLAPALSWAIRLLSLALGVGTVAAIVRGRG